MSESGLSPEKPANPFIQKICDVATSQAGKMVVGNFAFEGIRYATQGTKFYFIKASIGVGQYVHLRVYQRLLGNGPKFTLEKIVLGETLDEAIIYF